jgi:site-specific DNA-methyltransferase (adenine-specific)
MPPAYHDPIADIAVYEGDSLDVLAALPPRSVRLVLTDPPYVIGAVSAGTLASKAGSWGDMMNSAYWFQAWYERCWRLLTEDGSLWTFCNWRSLPVVMQASARAGIGVTSVLVWDKKWIGPGGVQGLRPRYELVALMGKPDFAVPDRGTPDVWEFLWSANKPTGHPAEKPVPLLRKIIRTCGLPKGSRVLDPFLGSGSTLVAAAQEGMAGVGIEQEPEWVARATERVRAAIAQPDLFGEASA